MSHSSSFYWVLWLPSCAQVIACMPTIKDSTTAVSDEWRRSPRDHSTINPKHFLLSLSMYMWLQPSQNSCRCAGFAEIFGVKPECRSSWTISLPGKRKDSFLLTSKLEKDPTVKLKERKREKQRRERHLFHDYRMKMHLSYISSTNH